MLRFTQLPCPAASFPGTRGEWRQHRVQCPPCPSTVIYFFPWHTSSLTYFIVQKLVLFIVHLFPNKTPNPMRACPAEPTSLGERTVPKHCPHFLRDTQRSHHTACKSGKEKLCSTLPELFSKSDPVGLVTAPSPDSLKGTTITPENNVIFWSRLASLFTFNCAQFRGGCRGAWRQEHCPASSAIS